MTPCPECASRPYLCFEHNETARTREEDAETLRLFATRWEARLEREERFAADLAKTAFYMGRKVAKGEMLLTKAHAILDAKATTLDDTLPVYAYILPFDRRDRIVADGFAAGLASVRRAR